MKHTNTAATYELFNEVVAKRKGLGHTSAMTVYSNTLTGRPWPREGSPSIKNIKTSEAVINTATQSGRAGNNRHRPIAEPRSSARSVLTMAISESA